MTERTILDAIDNVSSKIELMASKEFVHNELSVHRSNCSANTNFLTINNLLVQNSVKLDSLMTENDNIKKELSEVKKFMESKENDSVVVTSIFQKILKLATPILLTALLGKEIATPIVDLFFNDNKVTVVSK